MSQPETFVNRPIHPVSLTRRMLVGAGIALVLIIIFLSRAGEPDPSWWKYWMIKPLLLVPLAGAIGGLFYHLMDWLRLRGGWRRALANILSLLVYIFGLWIGTVLGLNGTMWN